MWVYAIQSLKDKRIHIGMAEDPEKRLIEHNAGATKSTKGFLPWKLIFKEQVCDREQARKKEKYYKGGSGKEFLKALAAKS